jgi:hypothetical protein
MEPRSSQFECRVEIENTSQSSLELLSVEVRMPEGVRQQKVFSRNVVDDAAEYRQICAEVGDLLLPSIQKELAKSKGWSFSAAPVERREARIRVMTADEAARAVQRFVGPLPSSAVPPATDPTSDTGGPSPPPQGTAASPAEPEGVLKLLAFKIEQLRAIERRSSNNHTAALATIMGGGKFSRTYIFDAKRRAFNSERYNVAFECSYKSGAAIAGGSGVPGDLPMEARTRSSTACSISFAITPKWWSMTLVAVGGALLGVALELLLPGQETSSATTSAASAASLSLAASLHMSPQQLEAGKAILASVITAIIFFNIYETTELGKKTEVGKRIEGQIGWRSALLIGSLCGLVNDKIVGALRALLA